LRQKKQKLRRLRLPLKPLLWRKKPKSNNSSIKRWARSNSFRLLWLSLNRPKPLDKASLEQQLRHCKRREETLKPPLLKNRHNLLKLLKRSKRLSISK
jgi:hypothetical protein